MKKLLVLLISSISAFAAYSGVRPIVIPHSHVTADLTNFPMVVSGTFPYLATTSHGGSVTSILGYDIIFTSDSGCTTKLNFERAVFNWTTGQSEFVVEVPAVSHTTDTTIYLCYGNSAVTTEQQSSPWDANYVTVNHLEDTPPTHDSTGNLTYTVNGSPTPAMRGKIQQGIVLNNGGSAPADTLSTSSSDVATSGDKTFEAWISPSSLKSSAVPTGIVTYGKDSSTIYAMQLRDDGSGHDMQPGFAIFDGTAYQIIQAATVPIGKWAHIVGVVSSTQLLLYVNGNQYSLPISSYAMAGDVSDSVFIGRDAFDTNQQSYLDGAIDEVRISKVARSAAWIKAEYWNESDPDSFYIIAPQATNSGNFTNVSVVGTTNTQAIIRFTHSSPASCTIAASKNSSLSPSVNDLNPALFVGENVANRDSANIIHGNTAQVVIGKRYKAYYGADGSRYSRALNQNSQYYFALNCGGDEYDGSFSTRPIAMGDTHLDGIPADSTVPGGANWPSPVGYQRCNVADLSCSISRRDTEYVDPQTGVLVKHLVMPSDSTKVDSNVQAALVTGDGWTIPAGWNTSTTAQATVTANTTPIALGGFQNNSGTGYSHAFNWGDVINMTFSYTAPVMMQFSVKANVDNAGCTAGNTNADCAMQVCVTLDWQTCAPNAQTYTQYLTTAATSYTFGSGQPYDTMQKAGKRIWTQSETSWRGGGVSCDGSTTVTKIWDSSTVPPDQDPVGSYIWLKPIGQHKITANIDALHFQVDTACPSSASATKANNDGPEDGEWFIGGSAFGVLVWKETNSADTLTLANAYINTLASLDYDPHFNSGFFGSPNSVTLPNGDPAAILHLRTGNYSLDLTNGKAAAALPYSPNSGVSPAIQSTSFDLNGNIWTLGTDRSLSKYVYQGDWQDATQKSGGPAYPQWEWDQASLLPLCTSTVTNQCYQSPTTITQAGQTLDVLLTAFDSRYSTNPFGNWKLYEIELGKLVFDIRWTGAPDTNYWGWIMVFDPDATSNVYGAYGAGCVGQNTNPAGANYLTPGCIVAAKRGWESKGARWATEKELGQMLQTGWVSEEETVNAFVGPGGGPAVANKTSIATTGTCPSNPFSLTACVTFVVDGDPFDFLDGTGRRGVLGTYAVGDYAQLGVDDVTYPGGPVISSPNIPLLQLVQISGTTLTFGCVYGSSYCFPGGGSPININPQMLWMYTNWAGFNYPTQPMVDIIAWDYADDPHGSNASGNTVVWDYSSYNAHGANGNALFTIGGTFSTKCTAPQSCYNNQNFQGLSNSAFAAAMLIPGRENVTGLVAMSSYFANHQGFNGACGNNNCQTHPDYSKLGSDPVSSTMLDGRPFVGIGGIPNTTDIFCVAGGAAGAQCAAGSSLYKIAGISAGLHPKIFDTMGTTARRILRNVSGPGSVIASDSSGYYTMCQALLANECRSGSSPGDFYVNIPYLDTFISGSISNSACYAPPGGEAGGTSDNWSINDLCIYDAGMEAQSYTRYRLDTFDMTGWSEQTFGHLFSVGRSSIYSGIHPATNLTSSTYKQWYYFTAQFWDGMFTTLLTEAPPISNDSLRRTTYVPVTVNVTMPSGADHYGVEFGYAEYGADGQGGFECSPNRSNDPCVATGSTVNETTPFYWESETPTGATSGTIAVPALPEHVLYYRPVFYSGTTVVGRGAIQTTVIQ